MLIRFGHSVPMAAHVCTPTQYWLVPQMPSLIVALLFTLPAIATAMKPRLVKEKETPLPMMVMLTIAREEGNSLDKELSWHFLVLSLFHSLSPNNLVGTVELGTGLAIIIITELTHILCQVHAGCRVGGWEGVMARRGQSAEALCSAAVPSIPCVPSQLPLFLIFPQLDEIQLTYNMVRTQDSIHLYITVLRQRSKQLKDSFASSVCTPCLRI